MASDEDAKNAITQFHGKPSTAGPSPSTKLTARRTRAAAVAVADTAVAAAGAAADAATSAAVAVAVVADGRRLGGGGGRRWWRRTRRTPLSRLSQPVSFLLARFGTSPNRASFFAGLGARVRQALARALQPHACLRNLPRLRCDRRGSPAHQVKLTELRERSTNPREFRARLSELATLLVFEVTRDLKRSPAYGADAARGCLGVSLARPVVVAPILRAGLGMSMECSIFCPT